MVIAICGTHEADIQWLFSALTSYNDYLCADACIRVFRDTRSLLAASGEISLALIDGDMEQTETARLFRSLRSDCPTVIWSDSISTARSCFNLHPLSFLLKPFSAECLNQALSLCPEVWTPVLKNFNIFSGKRTECVRMVEVQYVESFGHTCVLHRAGRKSEINQSLSVLHQTLGDTFSRCHRSYLVNLYYVEAILAGEMLLTNGILLPVGARWADSLQCSYTEYQALYGSFLLRSVI